VERTRTLLVAEAQAIVGPAAGRPVKPLAALLVAAVLYRLPLLLNAAALDSDGAVVALQARHILQGEWSWFLWGTNYQASFEPLMHALAFAVFGSGPLQVVCGMLAGALLMIALAFLALRPYLGNGAAMLCCAPLVFAPYAYNHFIQVGFRQWPLTAFIAAVCLFDRSRNARSAPALAFAAGALLFFMLYLDLFTLQVLPALLLLGVLRLRGDGRRLAAGATGVAAGALFFFLVRSGLPGAAPLKLELSRLSHNAALLARCGPSLAGAQVLWSAVGGTVRAWDAPWPIRAIQIGGALSLAVSLAITIRALLRVPDGTRTMGLFGLVAIAGSLAGFLLSTWPSDLASVRYLSPGAVALPFALAPAAAWLGARRFAITFSPAIVALLVSGWLSYGDLVRGPLPVRSPRGVARDEYELRDWLRGREIHAAAADYWLAYRLSFLWAEDPTVANVDGWERMPAYRRRLDQAPRQAWVFHPMVAQTPADRYERRLRRDGITFESVQIAGFTVLLFENPGPRK